MRRSVLFITTAVLLAVLASPAFSQTDDRDSLVGINPVGPLFGVYSGSFEQVVDYHLSVYVRAAYFDPSLSVLASDLLPETWEYWYLNGELGANYYPEGTAPAGFFAGVGVAPGYFLLNDAADVEVTGFQFGVVTQLGYQVLWGPVAIAPRVIMGHRWVFGDLVGIDDSGLKERKIEGVVSGFSLGVGLDVSIAF